MVTDRYKAALFCGSLLPVILCQSFGDITPYVHIIFVRFGCRVATFLEIAGHLVDHMLFLYFDYMLYLLCTIKLLHVLVLRAGFGFWLL